MQKQPIQVSKKIFFSSLEAWISRQNEQYMKWCLSRLKLELIQSKIKNIPKYISNFESIKSPICSIISQKQHSTNTTYVSISDFKPILDNYSSINMFDNNSSESNNYFSNRSMTDNLSNYQTVNFKKLTFANKYKNPLIEKDLVDKDTFLQNWMIRENSDFCLFQQYPKSNYCFKKIRSYHHQALESIKKYNFDTFCSKNIKPEGFIIRKPVKLKHKRQALSDSLIYLSEVQVEKALQINQNLLKAGGQIESPIHYIYHIYRILQILEEQSDDLIEQTYLQIIKQLESKKVIYMQILCVFACCVKPSARLYLPLLNYLVDQQNLCTSNSGICQQHYNYCFFHLIKNFDQPRQHLPSFYEIRCFMSLKKIPVTISFPKQKIFYIQSFTTVEELFEQTINFYDLDSQISYLFLINGCFLEKGNLLDKLSMYENKNIHKKWKDYEKFKTFRALIVLKNMNQYKKSKRCFNIMYNYYINQYLKGLFPLKQKDVIQIAGMIVFSEVVDDENFNFDFNKIVSARIRRKMQETKEEKNKYKNYILDVYYKFDGTKIEARKKIIEILSASKGYMTHFFKCSVFFDEFEEEENWVGIKQDKIIFIDPENGRFIRQIYYENISLWGSSKSQLCIKVNKLGLIHIETFQADVLTSIFQTYLNYIYLENQTINPKKQQRLANNN